MIIYEVVVCCFPRLAIPNVCVYVCSCPRLYQFFLCGYMHSCQSLLSSSFCVLLSKTMYMLLSMTFVSMHVRRSRNFEREGPAELSSKKKGGGGGGGGVQPLTNGATKSSQKRGVRTHWTTPWIFPRIYCVSKYYTKFPDVCASIVILSCCCCCCCLCVCVCSQYSQVHPYQVFS